MKHHRKRGTVLVEFLIVFPAFLVLSLFTLEIGMMWVDKHITRLAAFEAARSLAAAPMPEIQSDGTTVSDPCHADNAMGKARQAALRKMAIITPSVFYFNAGLGSYQLPGMNRLQQAMSALPGPAQRLLSRWPTAAALSKLNCHYDSATETVTAGITYHRAPQTPVVGRVMWVAHTLNQGGVNSLLNSTHLKPDFFGVEAELDAAAASSMRNAINSSLQIARDTAMEASQAADFLSQIPGVDRVFGAITSPLAIGRAVDGALRGATGSAQSHVRAVNDAAVQSKLLTQAMYAIPESLRFIPIHAHTSVARKIYGPNADEFGGAMHDPSWEAVIVGVGKLNEGVFNDWSRKMGEKREHIKDGDPL